MEDKNAKVYYINLLPFYSLTFLLFYSFTFLLLLSLLFLEVDILALVLRKYLAVGLMR